MAYHQLTLHSCFPSDNTDYIPPTSSIIFSSSSESLQTECINIGILDDAILENVETFRLEISTSVPHVTIAHNESVSDVSVVDDDSGSVDLVRSVYEVEEVEGSEVEVCVRLTGVTERAVKAEISTLSDTAYGETLCVNLATVFHCFHILFLL